MTLLEQIAAATAGMREKQKAYFKDRKQSALVESKEAEKKGYSDYRVEN